MKIEKLSGVTALLLIIISCSVSIFTKSYYMHALFLGWLIMLLAYFGFVKQSIIYLIVYSIVTFFLLKIVPKGVSFISPMLLGMLYKFILPVMAGFLSFKIPSGKIISIFRKCHLPQNFILIITVIIRFIPTISGEFRTIREAMKVRGFTGNIFKTLLHPLKNVEYSLVPLIFRSIKVGDELSAAAIVRGIENPVKKNSYYSNKLDILDFFIIGISTILFILCVVK